MLHVTTFNATLLRQRYVTQGVFFTQCACNQLRQQIASAKGFLACDKLTPWLKHKSRRVKSTYYILTTDARVYNNNNNNNFITKKKTSYNASTTKKLKQDIGNNTQKN